MAYTTIDDPTAYFQAKTYTGNYSTNAIILDGASDLQGDLIWLKQRDDASDGWHCYDSVRGVAEQLRLDDTRAESTTSGILASFDTDGFTLGANNAVNQSGSANAAFVWKGGTTSGITTTGADITPSAYSFNHTSRFSIAAYTGNGTSGAKIAHGLGAIPEVMIIKPRDRAGQAWVVYHHKNTSSPETDYLALDATDATADGAWTWNDTVPTSVYLETQNNNGTNASSNTFVLYTFRGVQGYSKFGSYKGNGNANGAFVYTGFRPAWITIKGTSGSKNWFTWYNKVEGFNAENRGLNPNTTAADNATDFIDLLSNGFKFYSSDSEVNSGDFIYMAFAEAPFVNSNGVPCNAR